MNKEKKKKSNLHTAKTMLILGMSAGMNYLITFFLTPYITDTIGIEIYGFVSIARTVVQYARIFTVAMTTFVVRFIFVSYDQKRYKEAESYYSSSLAGCTAVAGGIFILMLPIIAYLEYFLNIPSGAQHEVKLLFVLIFLSFVMQTIGIPLGASAYIRNRLDISGIIQFISYAADAVALLLLFCLFRPSVWFVGMGTLMSGVVTVIGCHFMTKKLTPDLRFRIKSIDYHKIVLLIKNGIWDSLNSLGNVLNSGLDLIISNLMLGGVITGQISVAKTIDTLMSGFYPLVFQAFQPRMLKAYSSGDKQYFMKELSKAIKVCGCFSNILLAGFFALGINYYRIWMPGQDSQALYILTVITILTGLTGGAMKPIYYVYTLTIKNKLPCIVTIGGGCLNIISMFLLLKYTNLGAVAVVATTAVIMIGINLFFNPLYAAKVLGVCSWPIYKILFRHLFSAGIMTITFVSLERILNPSGWIGLILSAALMAVIGLGIHSLIQGREEILSAIKKKVK